MSLLACYAIAVTLGCALLLVAQCRVWDQRDKAMALQERERQRLVLAMEELDRLDPTGLATSRVLLAEREGLH